MNDAITEFDCNDFLAICKVSNLQLLLFLKYTCIYLERPEGSYDPFLVKIIIFYFISSLWNISAYKKCYLYLQDWSKVITYIISGRLGIIYFMPFITIMVDVADLGKKIYTTKAGSRGWPLQVFYFIVYKNIVYINLNNI